MITAMEIRNQQFKKSFRGYEKNEVKNFIMQLAQDYENLYSENSQLKEKIQGLEYEMEKYRKIEETMNNSLILAQKTAEDLKANARKEADIMMEHSKKRIAEILMIYQEVIKRLGVFGAELKGQIGSEMEMLEKNQKKVDELSEFFFSKDLKEIIENLDKLSLKEE